MGVAFDGATGLSLSVVCLPSRQVSCTESWATAGVSRAQCTRSAPRSCACLDSPRPRPHELTEYTLTGIAHHASTQG